MQKSDLRSGMKITTRNGYEYIVMLNPAIEDVDLIDLNKSDYSELESYNDDLTDGVGDVRWDIVKVAKPCNICSIFSHKNETTWKIIWEREEIKEVTMNDIEEMFGCKIKIIEE